MGEHLLWFLRIQSPREAAKINRQQRHWIKYSEVHPFRIPHLCGYAGRDEVQEQCVRAQFLDFKDGFLLTQFRARPGEQRVTTIDGKAKEREIDKQEHGTGDVDCDRAVEAEVGAPE